MANEIPTLLWAFKFSLFSKFSKEARELLSNSEAKKIIKVKVKKVKAKKKMQIFVELQAFS